MLYAIPELGTQVVVLSNSSQHIVKRCFAHFQSRLGRCWRCINDKGRQFTTGRELGQKDIKKFSTK